MQNANYYDSWPTLLTLVKRDSLATVSHIEKRQERFQYTTYQRRCDVWLSLVLHSLHLVTPSEKSWRAEIVLFDHRQVASTVVTPHSKMRFSATRSLHSLHVRRHNSARLASI